MSLYLDHNATAKVRPQAIAAMADVMSHVGNPSSVHAAGRTARAVMEQAREDVARLIAAPASTVIFLSGGTEANALAMKSAVAAGTRRLIVSAVEHDSIRDGAEALGVAVEVMPVLNDGTADLDWLRERLGRWDADDGKPFVALMLANNETGVIQPVQAASKIVRAADGWLHVDAIQAAGKIPVDSRGLGADTLSISAHKIGGPQGIGALTFGPRATLSRMQHGGGQERGRRGGTENLPGIAGFGAAAREALAGLESYQAQAAWRDTAAARMKAAGAVVMGEAAPRLPNTLCVSTAGYTSDLQVMNLDLAGVMVSAGAACSSGKVKASPVLSAMGQGELASCAIRVSGGWCTTPDEWATFAEAWLAAHARHAARHAKTLGEPA